VLSCQSLKKQPVTATQARAMTASLKGDIIKRIPGLYVPMSPQQPEIIISSLPESDMQYNLFDDDFSLNKDSFEDPDVGYLPSSW
jgi:hypothetical protein